MVTKKYAVILAGGRGLRMGADRPKQFLDIEGKPLLRHTIEKFLAVEDAPELVIVLPSSECEYWKSYCQETGFLRRYTIVSGGITRFHSVRNALDFVKDGSVVAVHDGVRPLVSVPFLERLYREAGEYGAVVPVMPSVESLRYVSENGDSHAVDRSLYFTVQTPQVFRSELLKAAYNEAYSPQFTDDASVVEAAGYKVKLVEGEKMNIKITTPDDLKLCSLLISSFLS